MAQNLDLKELERKAFRSTFQDGLLDMFVGVVVLAFAVIPLLESLGDFWSGAVFLPVYLLAWAGFRAGKKGITLPRMGAIQPGAARKAKLGRLMAVIALAVGVLAATGLLVIALQQAGAALANWLFPGLLGLLAFAGFGVGATLLDLPRLYGYGVLVGLAAPAGELLYRHGLAAHHGWPISFGIAGSAIVIAGAVMLVRFVRAFPVVREAEP